MSSNATCPAPKRGFGAITMIVVLVLLAALSAAVVRMTQQAQTTTAQDVLGLRAQAAAQAGIEWAIATAVEGSNCADANRTLDLSSWSGMRVTVSCSASTFSEGLDDAGAANPINIYQIEAVACSIGNTCPATTAAVLTSPGYVERARRVQASDR